MYNTDAWYILYTEGSPFINEEYILHGLTTLNFCLDLIGKDT